MAASAQTTIVAAVDGAAGEASTQVATRLENARLGRYHLLRTLGAGGMGVVYEAFDPLLARKVAIKVNRNNDLAASPEFRAAQQANLLREARVLATVVHPNVVAIYDVGAIEDGGVYLAMELVVGESLRAKIHAAKIGWHDKLCWLLQAGEGLAAVHSAGLVHRDFKPDNVVVDAQGNAKVLDFGLAALNRNHRTPENASGSHSVRSNSGAGTTSSKPHLHVEVEDGVIAGTPAYMPAEQILGTDIDARADIFAFGCVLFEILYERQPFPALPLDTRLQAIRNARIAWPARGWHLPSARHAPWLRKIAAQLLACEPDERGSDLASIVTQIRDTLAHSKRSNATRGVAAGVVAAGLALSFAWAPSQPLADPDCTDPQALLNEAWTPRIHDELKLVFASSSMNVAPTFLSRAATRLGEWREDWIKQTSLLCAETRIERNLQPLTLMQREQSRACLMEGKAQVETLVKLWRHPTDAQILDAPQSVSSLTAPNKCLDLQYCERRAPLPIDPRERQVVTELRRAIESVSVLVQQHDLAGAERELATVAARLENVNDLPLMTEFQRVSAALEALARDFDGRASASARRYGLFAVAANRTFDHSMALDQVWYLEVYRQQLLEASEDLMREQESLLNRASHDRAVPAFLHHMRGLRAAINGDFAGALPHYQAIKAEARAVHGEKSPQFAKAFAELSLIFARSGNFEAAYENGAHALRLFTELNGREYPRTLAMSYDLSRVEDLLGFPERATAQIGEVLQICKEAGLEPELCAKYAVRYADRLQFNGEWELASRYLIEVEPLERAIGRTLVTMDTTSDGYLALISAGRGTTLDGINLCRRALDTLEAATNTHISSMLYTLGHCIEAAITHGDSQLTKNYLDRLSAVLLPYWEHFPHLQAPFFLVKGRIARWGGNIGESLNFVETALDQLEAANLPAHLRSGAHLEFAHSLLAAGETKLARFHAEYALSIMIQTPSLARHLRVPYHTVLAEIDLAEKDFAHAQSHLQAAQLDFDAREVLDNRLAPIHFLEAQALWHVDASPRGRAEARELARLAAREYSDWQGHVKTQREAIARWLGEHKS
jgi:serine/threonine protein kinase